MNFPKTSALHVTLLAASLACIDVSAAEPSKPFRIGSLNDMSGPYSALGGPGMVTAIKMAVDDFGGSVLGQPIEVLVGDTLLKPDVASTKTREWFDQDEVDVIIEGSDSGSAAAAQRVSAEKEKVAFLFSGSTALTNSNCTPYSIQYAWNTYAMANVAGQAIVKDGGSSWYFLTADYTFGKALEADTSAVVSKLGGKVLGSIRHPLGASDFASFLMSAQASKAKVIAFANAGRDTQNAIRQAREFGVGGGKSKVVPLLMFDSDVKGLGLDLAQGLVFTTAFYWDRNEETREWSNRFFKLRGAMPTMNQAGAYSATLQYLNAVKQVGSADAKAVMAKLKAATINDMFTKNGKIRKDGQMIHDMYLAEVKTPSESKGTWDMLKIKHVIPGDKAFQPLEESTCPFLKS